MVGRDVRDLTDWSTVPPAASLPYVWGQGGCALHHEGGGFAMGPGDWMWIDAGVAHRGENAPGSDFLTLFVSDDAVRDAGLDIAPIGAATQPAPEHLASTLTTLAALLLEGVPARHVERPALEALLDWVGTSFEPRDASARDPAVARVRALLRDDPRIRGPSRTWLRGSGSVRPS